MAKRLENESAEYEKLRAELLEAEIALKDQVKAVAALRRKLPLDTEVRDYEFREGDDARAVKLSELFDDPDKPLVLMHFMYGGAQSEPCPMCTMWADGYAGLVEPIRQRANFGVVAEVEIGPFRAWARERGWSDALRLLSSTGNGFKTDLRMQTPDGNQLPGVSVFARTQDGGLRHFYTQCAMMAPGHWNGMDLLSPVWHFFDLTPDGRGEFMPSRSYP